MENNNKEIILGDIVVDEEIEIGDIEMDVEKIYPALEPLTVIPSGEEQVFTPKTYGFSKVKVKGVESEEITITPSAETQVKEGLYKKVTVEGDSNFKEENIRAGTTMWGKTGTMAPAWDTSQIRSCYQMFYYNKDIIEAPYFDTSNVTNMYWMFRLCEKLTTVPLYDTSNVSNMERMFDSCENLLTVPLFNTSNVENMSNIFNDCKKLIEAPCFDTSNVTSLQGMFSACTNLITVPSYNMSQVKSISTMFNGCSNLTTIGELIVDSTYNLSMMFNYVTNLTTLGGLKNLGKGFTAKIANYSNYTLNLSSCNKLTHESLMNVINGLYDLNLTYDVANGGTLYSQRLQLGSTNMAKLTEEEIAIATNKGWNVA